MSALFIIFGLIFIIIFLLSFNLRILIKIYDGGFDLSVKYLFFKLYPLKEKKVKSKRKQKSAENNENDKKDDITDEEAVDDKQLSDVSDLNEEDKKLLSGEEYTVDKEKLTAKINKFVRIAGQIKTILEGSGKGLRKVISSVRIDDLVLDFVIRSGDAYNTAMTYGKVSAVTYNSISLVRLFLPITVKSVDVLCDFNGTESKYDGECKIIMRLLTLFHAGLYILWAFIKNWRDVKDLFSQLKESKT